MATKRTLRIKATVASVEKMGDTHEKVDLTLAEPDDKVPSGHTTVTIGDPDLLGKLVEGDSYFVDFTKAD